MVHSISRPPFWLRLSATVLGSQRSIAQTYIISQALQVLCGVFERIKVAKQS